MLRRFGFTNGADSAWFCFALQRLTVAKGNAEARDSGAANLRGDLELELTLTRD